MKKRTLLLTIVITSLFTLFSVYEYSKRASFNYTDNGTFLCPKSSIIYKEQTKEVYAVIAFVSFIFTVILLHQQIKVNRRN